MSLHVRLIVGTTNVVCKATDSCPSYWEALRKFANKALQTFEYQPRLKKFMPDKSYCKFLTKAQTIIIPINFLPAVKSWLDSLNIPYSEHSSIGYETRKMDVRMNPEFTDRSHQIAGIEYLTCGTGARVGLQLQTGKGKTYSATKAMVNIGKVGMVVVSGLVRQWAESILHQTAILDDCNRRELFESVVTKINEDDARKVKENKPRITPERIAKSFNDVIGDKVYIIQGFDSLIRLFDSELKPDIFIWSLETLREFLKHQGSYDTLPRYPEFIKYYGIGTKIMDEVHLNFHAGTMIDLAFNIERNIYLTATFTTSNQSLRKIFNTIYSEEVRFGAGNYDKYVDVTFYGYMGNVPEKSCVTNRGYNHGRYEKHMLKRKTVLIDYFERVLIPVTRVHFVNNRIPGMKCVIFCSLTEMIEVVVQRLAAEWPELNVLSYVAADPESNLTDGDLIVSTHKSAGTGKDIAKLHTVINTVSFKTPTLSKQVLGRLRKLKNEEITPVYIDLLDMNLSSHMRHWRERSAILKSCAKSYSEYRIG